MYTLDGCKVDMLVNAIAVLLVVHESSLKKLGFAIFANV